MAAVCRSGSRFPPAAGKAPQRLRQGRIADRARGRFECGTGGRGQAGAERGGEPLGLRENTKYEARRVAQVPPQRPLQLGRPIAQAGSPRGRISEYHEVCVRRAYAGEMGGLHRIQGGHQSLAQGGKLPCPPVHCTQGVFRGLGTEAGRAGRASHLRVGRGRSGGGVTAWI